MSVSDGRVFDIAIVGAGVSGLTLAWLLTEATTAERSILLVDGARDDEELRTLSFWSEGPLPLEPLVVRSWSTLRFHSGGDAHDITLADHTYRTLFFADLQRETNARLARSAAHEVVLGRVAKLEEDEDGVTLQVGSSTYRARWVLDSRFRLPDLEVDLRRYHDLKQHVHGWMVRAPRDAFEPGKATLLDFRVDGPSGTVFVYVLPFSAREALVELVALQPVDAEPLLQGYLERAFGLDDVEIIDREAGVSPMTEQPFLWRGGARCRRIGIAAGRLKPSTGYALTRIVDDARAIVRALDETGSPMVAPRSSLLYRLLDSLLLEVWAATPWEIPGIFRALFSKGSVDRVLRFLDERASFVDVLRVAFSLPKLPFVRALFRWIGRRLGLVRRRARGPTPPGPSRSSGEKRG